MSAPSQRRIATRWPSASRRFSVTDRLLRARIDHHSEWSLWRRRPQSRIASPPGGASIFTTSAPNSPTRSPWSGLSASAPRSPSPPPSLVVIDHLREELGRADDVHAHGRLGEPGLAALEPPQDQPVAEQRLRPLRVVVPERGAEHARDAGDGAHRGLEPRRLRRRDDDAVELLVERHLVVDGPVV